MSVKGDRLQVRFLFAAPSLRAAADLAAALRIQGRNKVQVRHGTARGWTVIATTPPRIHVYGAMRLWESEMEAMARRHPGCRIIDWARLPQPDSATP
jgi:hypothetical protein